MQNTKTWLAMLIAGVLAARSTTATTIYNGALNTPPESQGYVLLGPPGATVYETQGAGKVTLNTAASANQAGWANNFFPLVSNQLINPAFPVLNSGSGFTLGFDLKVLSESHDNANRAGFDIILLDSNHIGVELSFWNNEVWAQKLNGTAFEHGEGQAFTTTNQTHYDLSIKGGTYTLFAGNNPILTGNTRDYLPGDASPDPYGLPNYLFAGDDTTSATASVELSSLTIAPEPASGVMLILLVGITRRQRLRHSVL